MVRGRRRFFRNSVFLLASIAFAVSSLKQRLRAVDAFADVTDAVGLKGLGGGVAAWVDYDADGWGDLWASGQLWRNIKGEKFERAENQPAGGAGIWANRRPGRAPAWTTPNPKLANTQPTNTTHE